MVGFDIPFAFVFGGLLGWRSGGQHPDTALLCAGFGIAMPGLAFLEAYPDWDWQYLIDPASLPLGVPSIFVGLVLLAAWLGHRVGGRQPRIVVGVTAVLALYLLISLPRIPYVGTRAEYLSGDALLLPVPFLLFCAGWMTFAGLVLGMGLWRVEQARKQATAST